MAWTVTSFSGMVTVMVNSLVKSSPSLLPFAMVALTITSPAAVAVRTLSARVALPLSTLQTMVWLVAFAGSTVALRVRGCPTLAAVGTPVISDTATNSGSGSWPPAMSLNLPS